MIPLKTDQSGEICTGATWAKPFLSDSHPKNWFMPATAQLENVTAELENIYYYY